jgi:hypothetical protein
MQAKDEKLDVLYGAPAIGKFCGLSVRQVYHQQANLGLGKLGAMLIGSKAKLRERLTAPKKSKEQVV